MNQSRPPRGYFSPQGKRRRGSEPFADGRRKAGMERLEPRRLLSAATPGLADWFTADSISAVNGSAVSAWQDSSGSGATATQLVASQRPAYLFSAIDSHPAISFDAANNTQLSFARPVSGDFSLMVVFKSSQGVGQSTNWYSGAGLVDGEVAGTTSDFGLSLNALGQVLGGTGMPDTTMASATEFNDGRPHVATFTRVESSGALSLYVDGHLFAQGTGGTQALTAPSRLTIGSIQTNKNYFTGDIAQVRVYSISLSSAARQSAEQQLETEYDIGSGPTSFSAANPVINRNFPDPGVIQAGGFYYLFATNGSGGNVQAARSTNLMNWTTLPDALPTLPTWAQSGRTWGPDASLMANGKYDLYFTAWSAATGEEAVGVAVANSAAGPYVPQGSSPLVAQFNQGGAIDPSVFTSSSGVRYLLWKNDGNAVGQTTFIYIQQLSSDGLSLVDPATPLIHEDQPWEGSLVEGPTLWQHGNTFDLFYCANSFSGAAYAIGYATSSSIMGTYVKPAQPLLQTGNGVIGPGGPTIVVGPDGYTYMLYHSWFKNFSYRGVDLIRLNWNGDTPTVTGPSLASQPIPTFSTVLGRYVFYNNSVFDGNDAAANIGDDSAIATDKQALLSGQTATLANYTSYSRGINGIMIDVSRLPGSVLTAADFLLQVGNTTTPASWNLAPAPASIVVRPGEGVNGSDRIMLTWADNAIQEQWLRVTLIANADTGLAANDVFYFGNAIGETGNMAGNTLVNASDQLLARANVTLTAGIANLYDFNRDGRVDAADEALARLYGTTFLTSLRLITAV